ncbi:MAG: hypothetical protein NVS9B4_00190 [Candidatus Acidiferrum sp.]
MRALLIISIFATLANAQLWRDRLNHNRGLDAPQIVEVAGGQSFTVPLAINAAFERVLNGLKRDGESIEEADPVIGRIATALRIEGSWTQTGRRLVVVFIKDSEHETTVRVCATTQSRHQLRGMVKPWSTPRLDGEGSERGAALVKAMVGK